MFLRTSQLHFTYFSSTFFLSSISPAPVMLKEARRRSHDVFFVPQMTNSDNCRSHHFLSELRTPGSSTIALLCGSAAVSSRPASCQSIAVVALVNAGRPTSTDGPPLLG